MTFIQISFNNYLFQLPAFLHSISDEFDYVTTDGDVVSVDEVMNSKLSDSLLCYGTLKNKEDRN